MGQRLAGTCYITVDGETLLLQGSLSSSMEKVTRDPLIANGSVVGFSETKTAPTITGTVFVPKNFPIAKLQDGTNMTVVVEYANGMTSTLSGAWVSSELVYSGMEGTLPITFTGEDMSWS